MSQENVEVVRSHYEAYIRQDLEATLAPLHDNIETDLSATNRRVYARHISFHVVWRRHPEASGR